MNRPALIAAVLLALCAAGAWISSELLWHGPAGAGASGGGRGLLALVCGSAETSCAGALDSRWARFQVPVPLPSRSQIVRVRRVNVPVAFVGLAYFVAIAAWYGLTMGGRLRAPRWDRLPLHVATAGVATSLFFIGLMVFRAAPWCRGCLLVHAINFGVLLAVRTLLASPGLQAARPPLARREVVTAIAMIVVLLGGAAALYRQHAAHGRALSGLRPYRAMVAGLQADRDFLLREHRARPRHLFPRRVTEAPAGDRAELTVFTSFRCPACACNARWIRDDAPRHFEDGLVVRVRHVRADDAALFAEAVRRLGGEAAFARAHERLFENARGLGPEAYRAMAADLGLDADAIAVEMDSAAVRAIVDADVATAAALGVTGTPTMFLDGRRIPEICNTDLFWRSAAADRRGGPRVAGGTAPGGARP